MTPTEYIEHEDKTQLWLADQLGIKKGHMSRLLNGSRNWTTELACRMQRLSGNRVLADTLVQLPEGFSLQHTPTAQVQP